MNTPFSVLLYVNEKSNSAWIKRSLESVLSNTVCPDEIVIAITGNISDEIKSIIAELQKKANIQIFSHPVPYGRGTTFKMFLSRCSHELIALQDVEAISMPNRFEKQLAYFKEHPQTTVLGSWCQEIDDKSFLPTAIREVPEKEEEIKIVLKRSAPFICRTVMLKKSVVEAVGDYKTFPMFENEYLWTRIIAKGYKTVNLPEVLVQARAYGYPEVLAWPYFKVKKDLFYEMRSSGIIGSLTYYYLVSKCFVRYMLMPNWLRNLFYHERLITD